ncbi:MAG: hypothetical protein ACOY35_01150 [Bacillota bacterium]
MTVDLDQPVMFNGQDGWGNYPKGIINCLLENGYPLKGCDDIKNEPD